MEELPVDVVGRLKSPSAALKWGARFLRIKDDYPGGIYVLWSEDESFSGVGYDNWFESWGEVRRFLSSIGEIEWL